MECLQIDWKNLDHTFERDDFYESFQAPKWIDFTAPLQPVDDHEWFCAGKTGCTHLEKLLWQPPEESMLTDLQENQILQVVPPLAEIRAKEVVSSSHSSLSSIKEASVHHKSLQAAQTGVAKNNKQEINRSMHARENQNPNQDHEVQPGGSEVPVLKAVEDLAKKLKTSERNTQILGKPGSTALSEQKNRSHTRAVLGVTKSLTSIGKESVLKRSTTTRLDAKETKTVAKEEVSVPPKITRYAAASRMPFSVQTTSRSAVTSSLVLPPRRPMNPARCMQNIGLGIEKSALCRPPRVVVRKDHKTRADPVTKPNKKSSAENAVSSRQACEKTSSGGGFSHVEPIADQLMRQERCYESSLRCDGQLLHECREDDENDKDMHALATEHGQSAQMTLERHLESLCLSTPGHKLISHELKDTDDSQKQEVASYEGESHHVTTAVSTSVCGLGHFPKNATEHEDVNRTLPFQEKVSANDTKAQMDESSVIGVHVAGKQNLLITNKKIGKNNQLNRGLKRKSCELDLKIHCSAKDHRNEGHKVSWSVASFSSLLHQQAKQVSILRSPLKPPPSLNSCKEQHKKLKPTKVQLFKPFRLRTEERCALRDLGLGKKEQGVSNPQGQAPHHALRMPTFGHPFRPQRSMKKLTIPKEPNFHNTRTRKACTAIHHTTMLTS